MCPINGTGYGITSANISLSLFGLNVNVGVFVIGQGVMLDNKNDSQNLVKMLNNARTYNPDAPCLKIWHQHDLGPRVGRGKYYAFPFFEADKFHDFEIHQMNQTDALFTASKWGKKVLEDNGVNVPIVVSPLGVNLRVFNSTNKIKIQKDKYVFLHVGKWEKRKSQDFLLEAFGKAFTKKDEVELWLLPHNPFLSPEETEQWLGLVNQHPLSDKIKVYNRLPTQKDVADLIHHTDCGVFLSRAEGWNNEITEMMAMDKPVIATNYSAHTEYLTKDNSFMVDVTETEPANDGKWFHGHGNWGLLGSAQMEQTVEYMKFVYNNRVSSNPAGIDTAKKYSWDRTASIIRETVFN